MNKIKKTKNNLLIEIGTQELPQKKLRLLGESFKKNIINQFKQNHIKYNTINWYATQRRIALKILNLYNQKKEKKKKIENKILLNLIKQGIDRLPVNYFLYFENKKIKFARPVNYVLILLNNKIINGNILGVKINKFVYGNRFFGKKKFIINSIKEYTKILYEKGKVIVNFEKRKNLIKEKIEKITNNLKCFIKLQNYMLEEITSLVEWPVVLNGKFKNTFLKIPKEILLHIIEKKQKYFSTYNSKNKLTNNFIFVVNTNTKNIKNIIYWNEKILNSHLKDINFFYKLDNKKLEEYLPKLKNILFQKSTGTMYDKSIRLKYLSKWIARKIGGNEKNSERAGLLSKCDLMTNMVSEFKEIKGIVGMYYSIRDKEHKEVSLAIKNQYSLDDNEKNTNKTSHSLFLAEKMDNLIGIFEIKDQHKKSNDPFALKKIVNEIFHIILKYKYNINLTKLINKNIKLYKKLKITKNTKDIIQYISKRLFNLYKNLKYNKKVIKSVLKNSKIIIPEIDYRIKSISHFYKSKEFEDLIKINKRISNILKKTKEKLDENFSFKLTIKKEEKELANYLFNVKKDLNYLLIQKKYDDIMKRFFLFKNTIDPFFKNVFILDKNKKIRMNRLILLKEIQKVFLTIADISLLN